MSGCCGNVGDVMILACSGGSNVGQITNQAAVELTREGHGKMFCLAGIGAQLQGFVKSAQDTSRIVVLDMRNGNETYLPSRAGVMGTWSSDGGQMLYYDTVSTATTPTRPPQA